MSSPVSCLRITPKLFPADEKRRLRRARAAGFLKVARTDQNRDRYFIAFPAVAPGRPRHTCADVRTSVHPLWVHAHTCLVVSSYKGWSLAWLSGAEMQIAVGGRLDTELQTLTPASRATYTHTLRHAQAQQKERKRSTDDLRDHL